MIRHSVLDGLEMLFDPALRLAEEFELFMRILYRSKAVYQAEPVAVYRIHRDMSSFQLRDGWSDEFRLCLERFRVLDSAGNYPEELAVMEWKISYNEALLMLVRGELGTARRAIAPHRFRGVKAWCLYVVTFLPGPLWAVIRSLGLWGKHVYLR